MDIDSSYPDFKKLVEDMFLTLEEASGVGLAAPQIGKNIRLFVVDCTPWGDENPELAEYRRVFVNPEIYERSEEISSRTTRSSTDFRRVLYSMSMTISMVRSLRTTFRRCAATSFAAR